MGVVVVKLIIVDDNHLARSSMDAMLTACNFRVESASSGSQAMQIAESFEPDVLIVDFHLDDGLDGVQVAEMFRESFPQIINIIISGYSVGEIESRVQYLPLTHVLAKPVRLEQLLELIRRENGTQ